MELEDLMKSLTVSLIGVCLLAITTLIPLRAQNPEQTDLPVDLLNNSSLVVLGETNVNNYECSVVKAENDRIEAVADYYADRIELDKARLSFPVSEFDCGMKAITKEFRKALKSDTHPELLLEIKRIYSQAEDREKQELHVKSDVIISLAGVTREMTLDFHRVLEGPGRLRYRAEPELKMSDFQVDPPKVLFGSIKADDAIRVAVDVVFQLRE